MTPVKINVFISSDRADGKYRQMLLEWLYPMRDEVNLWYDQPPVPPPALPLPWQILLFWYVPRDHNREEYMAKMQKRKERAHIYLFLTSYKSIINQGVQGDISMAVNRRIATGDDLNPLVFPVLLSPSHWQQYSGLAGYRPLGPKKTLAEVKPVEEGFLQLTDQLAKYIKVLQRRLTEERFYQSRPVKADAGLAAAPIRANPYLGDDDEATEIQESIEIELPEWLGWALIAFLIVLTYRSMQPAIPQPSTRYRSYDERQIEYQRTVPMIPSEKLIEFPPPD